MTQGSTTGAKRPVVEAILREDAETNGGGDVVQARAYLEILRANGYDATESTFARFMRRDVAPDVVLVFNTARPAEWIQSIRHTQPETGVVGIPIHHPESWFDDFERNGRTGKNRVLGWVRPHARRSSLKALIRNRNAADLKSFLRPSILTGGMRDSMDGVDALIVLAEGELRYLETDLGRSITSPIFRVPNGVATHTVPAVGGRSFDVLIVGRVQERKNVNHALRALADTGLSIGVVGATDPSCPGYVREFMQTVDEVTGAEFLGPLPHSEVLGIMSRSRVYVSTSWFEVVSLAELEAATMGMAVVGTTRSFGEEYLPDRIGVDPRDGAALARAVTAAMATARERTRDRVDFPWEAGASALVEAVETAREAADSRRLDFRL